MSKALVIKNADFSANRLGTITFEEEVPCTGVAFDSASVTLTSLGVASIGYTITPANTTDTPTLTSSDSTILDVNGMVVTATGIGTATLTLSCGSYTATCVVAVSIIETPVYISGFASVASAESTGEAHDSIFVDGSSVSRIFCTGDASNGFFAKEILYKNPQVSVGGVTAIKIPSNATAIHVNAKNVYSSGGGGSVRFLNADEEYTYNTDKFIPIVSTVDLTVTSNTINEDVLIPSGATGYILVIRPRLSSEYSSMTTEEELKTYAEENCGISIGYK